MARRSDPSALDRPLGPGGASYVLVIEEDPDARDALVVFLDDRGYDAVGAESGSVALAYLWDAEPPKMIILALGMPGTPGWEFLALTRRTPALETIPVVVCSAHLPSAEALGGVQAVLPKPVDTSELLRVIEALTGIRGRRSSQP